MIVTFAHTSGLERIVTVADGVDALSHARNLLNVWLRDEQRPVDGWAVVPTRRTEMAVDRRATFGKETR